MSSMLDKLAGSWKAILALLIPIAFGAAAEGITVIQEWVTTNGGVWAGIATGILTSAGVWLKANKPTT